MSTRPSQRREHAVERLLPGDDRGRARLAVAVDEEVDVVGILGQEREDRVHVVHESWRELLRRDREEVLHVDARHT